MSEEYKKAAVINEEFYHEFITTLSDDMDTYHSLENYGLLYKLRDKTKTKYVITYMMKVGDLNDGDEFGELALLTSAARAATIIAESTVYLAILNK